MRALISWRTIILGMALGAGVIAAVGVASDLRSVLSQLQQFPAGSLVPAILALTLFNYALRFLRWHWLIRRVTMCQVGWPQSLLAFFSGFSMVMTPGKVGELIKSYVLKAWAEVPMSRSAPVVFAERLYDGIAMVVLSLIGVLSFGTGLVPVVGFAMAALVAVWVLSSEELAHRAIKVGSKVPLLRSRTHAVADLLTSARELITPRVLVGSVGVGVLSWFGECAAFYLVLVGLGMEPSAQLLLLATFVLAVATLVGSMSMLPGGVGAAELTMSGMLVLLGAMERDIAGAATILIRVCTLWFGALLGALCLAAVWFWLRSLGRPEALEFP